MADNIILSSGTGDGGTVATDEVSSRHFQIVKLAEGGDGVAVLVSGSAPLSVKGTTDFPLPVTGTVAVLGTVTVVGSVNTNSTSTGTMAVYGTVTQPVYVTGSVSIAGTTPVAGSVTVIGGSVGVQVISGSVNVSNQGGSVAISGGTLAAITGTVNIVGSVSTTTTPGTTPVFGTVTQPVYVTGSVSVPGTVNVVASAGDAQKTWGAATLIQIGVMTPAGTVAANAGLPISGTLAAITGTVTIVGSVSTTTTPGTTPVIGVSDKPVYITGSVSIPGTSPVYGSVSIIGGALTGTSPVSGSVTIISGSVGVQVISGSINVSNQGGSVQISGGTLAAITGTVPVSGSVSIIGGALSGTSPVSGSVTVIGGSVGVQVISGSMNISNQGGSVQVSSGSLNVSNQGGSVAVSSISGTLPDFAQNRLFRMPEGVTGSVIGTVSLTDAQATGDYLSHLIIMAGSTDANMVILIDGTTTSFRGTVFVSVPGPGKCTYTVPIDAYSRFGPWKLTTGGGVLVVAAGRFTT